MAGKVYEIAFQLAGRLASSFSGSFRAANSAMAGLARGQKQLASSTQQATAAWNRQAEATTKATAAMAKLDAQSKAHARLSGAKAQVSKNAGAATATGAAIGGGTVFAVKSAIQFESAMADVAKTVDGARTADGKLTQKYYALEDAVLRLGTKIPLAYEELASIMAAAGQLGISDEKKMEKFTEVTAQMAVSFGISTDAAAASIGGFQAALHLSLDGTREVLDLINQFANTTSATEADIANVVNRVGALGAVNGVTAKSVTALAATLEAMKIPSEVAATGIQNLMLGLTAGSSATKSQAAAFAKLGLSATGLAKRMQKDANGAILDVLKRIRKLPKYEQAATLTNIFGKESIKAIAPLLTQLDLVEKNLKLASDPSQYRGAMEKEFKNRTQTTEASVQLMMNSLKTAAISLGSVLLPVLSQIIAKVSPLVERFVQWAKANKPLVQTIMMVGAGIGAFAVAAVPAVAAFKTLAFVVSVVKVAFAALNVVMTMNPIGLIVVAVGALAGGLIYLWYTSEGFRNFFIGMWDSITAAVSRGWGVVSALFEAMGNSISQSVSAKGAEFLSAITTSFTAAVQTIQSIWEGVKTFFSDLWSSIAAGFTGMVNGIISGINRIVSGLNSLCSFKVPDWVPGIGGKGFQAKIPEVPKMATGGVVTDPTLALLGEGASPEAVVPLDRLSSFLGSSSGGVGGITISFAPVINLSGGSTAADPYAEVRRGLSAGAEDLKKQLERVLADQRRLSYS